MKKYILFSLFAFVVMFSGCTQGENANSSIVNNSSHLDCSSNVESSVISSAAVSDDSGITSGEYTYTVKHGKITLEHFNGDESNVIIPNQLDGKPVVILGKTLFSKN